MKEFLIKFRSHFSRRYMRRYELVNYASDVFPISFNIIGSLVMEIVVSSH